jgi:uncharacterized protein YjiS (DUF1127 family)
MFLLRKIFRAIAVGQAAVAANRLLHKVSNRQLDDVGISRTDFVQECMNKVIADFAAQDAPEASKPVRNIVDNMTNANLVGAV